MITKIQKSLGKGSDRIVDSVIDHNFSVSKYNPLVGSSDIIVPKELDHLRKGFINAQDTADNECFKWYLVRFLNATDHNQRRAATAGKDFAKRLDFKNIKSPVKVRGIQKIEKKNFIGISVSGFLNKEKYPIYLSTKLRKEEHVDVFSVNMLLVEDKERKTMFLLMILRDS